MASSNSGSDGDLHQIVDDRKRKRMESNRESARRSRMKKQMHLDDLTAQISHLRRENQQVIHTIDATRNQSVRVEAENSVLRAQMSELAQRLESLNQMVNDMNTLGRYQIQGENVGFFGNNGMGDLGIFNEPWSVGGYGYLNQPIMASPDFLHY